MIAHKKKKFSNGYLFTLPWMIGFCLFTAYPLFSAIWLSFNKVLITTAGIQTKFLGIGNFTYAFAVDPDFMMQLGTYVYQIVLIVPMVLVFSMVLALLLNQKIPLRHFFRAVFFLPVILVNGPVLNEMSANGATQISGLKEFVVYRFLASMPGYLASPLTYIFDNIINILWLSGVQILVLMIGLQKADRSIYEAAMVDGASHWEQFWKITLPNLKPFLFIDAVYSVVDISAITSPIIKLITQNMDNPKTGYGYSSAVALLYFAVIAILIAVSFLLFGRGGLSEQRGKAGKKTNA